MYTDSGTRCQVYPLWKTLSIGETCRLASQKPSRPESATGFVIFMSPPGGLKNSPSRERGTSERDFPRPSITVHFD
jgi:hypothetical protein